MESCCSKLVLRGYVTESKMAWAWLIVPTFQQSNFLHAGVQNTPTRTQTLSPLIYIMFCFSFARCHELTHDSLCPKDVSYQKLHIVEFTLPYAFNIHVFFCMFPRPHLMCMRLQMIDQLLDNTAFNISLLKAIKWLFVVWVWWVLQQSCLTRIKEAELCKCFFMVSNIDGSACSSDCLHNQSCSCLSLFNVDK